MRAVTERQFFEQLRDLAHLLGWRIVHFRAARTKWGWETPVAGDGKGYPDTLLVSIAQCRVIWAELKRHGPRAAPLTAEQGDWHRYLHGAGFECYTWTPGQLDEIQRILEARP